MSSTAGGNLASNAKWFMIVSVVQKIITFCLNQIMVMSTSPEVLGQAAIQLELLLSTLLFLSREGIRLSVLRSRIESKRDFRAIVNISWVPPCIVLLLVVAISYCKEYLVLTQDFTILYMYSAAAFIECLGESSFNTFQNAANIKPRLSAETTAVFVKSCTTVLCVAYFNLGVKGFAIAQIAYSVVYLVVLLSHIAASTELQLFDMLPSTINTEPPWRSPILNVAITLTGSSILKHLLTESDKIALTLSASSYNQGIYAVTNNYGSLAARIIYLPLEDSSRLSFAKLTADFKSAVVSVYSYRGDGDTGIAGTQIGMNNRKKAVKSNSAGDSQHTISAEDKRRCNEHMTTLLSTFVRLLRLVAFIGLFFVIFGIPYVGVMVQFVLGSKWRSSETVSALSMYCLYLLVMGINGITESFVQSAAPASAFRVLNLGLILSSVGFVAAAVPAVSHLGTSGIILANAISMVVRIGNNSLHIVRMFANPCLFFDLRPFTKLTAGVNADVSADVIILSPSGTADKLSEELPSVSVAVLLRTFAPPPAWVGCVLCSILVVQASAYWYALSARSIKHAAIHVVVGGLVAVVFLVVSLLHAPEDDRNVISGRLAARFTAGLTKKKSE